MKSARIMRGMTLLEMLVAMAIFGVVMLTIGHAISMMQNTWTKVRGKADGFRNTRLALDLVAGRIGQATLNQRWKFDDSGTSPQYVTDSDLHFVSGPARVLLSDMQNAVGHAVFFQAPFGESDPARDSKDMRRLNSTLNAWGYFVEYGPDKDEKPAFMNDNPDRFPPRNRFRLLEFRQPASELTLFDMDDSIPPMLKINKATSWTQLFSWFHDPIKRGATHQSRHLTVVAENILAFIVTPLDPRKRDANSDLSTPAPYQVAPNSMWNSRGFQIGETAASGQLSQRHHLPPAVQLTAIAISEDAWLTYSDGPEDQARL
ncbi:MAG: Verru Chthon cassette protein, partial [Verrucomicrobiaceae bacterium]|nr:Verru Chthon cassette protein [Verrucomicrobiaceae bacterium]